LPKEIQLEYNDGCCYYTYAITLKKRDSVAEHLSKNGIGNGVYFPIPIHLQPIYKQLYGYKGGEFPVAETFARETLSLPVFPEMTDEDTKIVCEKVNEVLS